MLEIEEPQHGWAPTTITLGSTRVRIDTSAVGPDSFDDLARCALYALEAEGGSSEAEFYEEPSGHIFTLRHMGEGKVEVTLHATGDLYGRPLRRKLVASVESTAFDMALALWRGLRAHEQMLTKASAAEHWRGFPTSQVEALGALLKKRGASLREGPVP
jgi:hypothetical protein